MTEPEIHKQHSELGISGRLAQRFQNNAITPLLALLGLLLGFFAIVVTPKEEEPQIDVTFANVFIGFPGASAKEVEHLISTPAEQVLSEISGVDDIYSVSRAGMSILTVAFEVGLNRETAILNLYNQIYSHQDWLPANLGASQPIIKPQGIDDVPIMSLTLFSEDPSVSSQQLTELAHTLEVELKRIPGTRDIYTLGGQKDVVNVRLDPVRLNAYQLTIEDVTRTLLAGNTAAPIRHLYQTDGYIQVQAGHFLTHAQEVKQLVIGLADNHSPVYLSDVADVIHEADIPDAQVMHFEPGLTHNQTAVTLAIAKQAGENAFDITSNVEQRLQQLKNIVIPPNIQITTTRNYGDTAKSKSDQLMAKLLFAAFAVILLVLITMSWREAVIVGGAIFITLALTLFASWAWGFTLNRISLFALIFSIGILVDDAIVVVENIHRHLQAKTQSLLEAIPKAVEEVGNPTILATFTVIAALMPMAFVSGLMGPYMSPIPINASTGMLISLAVAFIVTPWLSYQLLNKHMAKQTQYAAAAETKNRTYALFNRIVRPLIQGKNATNNRLKMLAFVIGLIMLSVLLPVMKLVVLKMLPFDNKSEFQILVDMPEGTPMEDTLIVLNALGEELKTHSYVSNFQIYAGVNAPINFNGLVRQYYLRNEAHMGDIQVNLIDKSQRDMQSHDIALQLRPQLQKVAQPFNASIKLAEVPPGPPVMAPIVAEVYGAHYQQQIKTANKVRSVFENTPHIVDVDDNIEASQKKTIIYIDRQKAAQLGMPYDSIVNTLDIAMGGKDVSYLHSEHNKFATPIRLEYHDGHKANWHTLLETKVTGINNEPLSISHVASLDEGIIEKTIYHKNLRPVIFVNADTAGGLDSPLYGLFDIWSALNHVQTQSGNNLDQYFINPPLITNKPAIKWDGEWQITYETFRDMGIAYGVGMILIYLLIVAQFKGYLVPLIIMSPIPLTIIGIMPGHALLGAQFTATSMIGMIALAGIIVRNSILLVDFMNQELTQGADLVEAAINSAAVRAKPIMLTGIAAMTGAFFILDDPIFNGLAISLIFGILISTVFTLILVPMLYFVYKR